MPNNLTKVELNNYGVLPHFSCNSFKKINLIIGENGCGKTFLLKSLYSAVRSMEEYKRGDDITPISDLLANKLRWTFQVEKLGDIVNRSSETPLSFNALVGDEEIGYQFSKSAVSNITKIEGPKNTRNFNSVFIPAKEVLSLFSIITKSREIDKAFGFDETYYDLVKALNLPTKFNNEENLFSEAKEKVSNIIDGKVEYDETTGKWFFKNNKNQKFSIGATSEGVKKISILDRLLSNGYISNDSIIFIDELESALHPSAICNFLDMIDTLAENTNIQFFITSHSYFVIKKLALIAMDKKDYVKCISLTKDLSPKIYDLSEAMPHNSIIDTSIQLYEESIAKGL